jgi:hypothetical protein
VDNDRIDNQTLCQPRRIAMNLHLSLGPLIALLCGILILIMPRLLNYIIALYLIIFGILGLVGDVHFHY